MTDQVNELRVLADEIAEETESDVLFFNGDITQRSWLDFVHVCRKNNRRKNLLMILVTPGGNPDAAFKIGRLIQSKYQDGKICIFISGWCKSAGTLIALAANHLYIGDYGELGPLDIQIAKSDEIAEMGSGLTIDSAMKTLEGTASRMFINLLYSIRKDTRGMVMTRTASELAANMVTRVLEPIYSQIDPLKIGENSRAMLITQAYGQRLAAKSHLLQGPRSLEYLVSAYPDHGFVIDREEASSLFTSVSEPSDKMKKLAFFLGAAGIRPNPRRSDEGAQIEYLSTETAGAARSTTPDDEAKTSTDAAKTRSRRRTTRKKPRTSRDA